jgi:RNase P subunit RPR2
MNEPTTRYKETCGHIFVCPKCDTPLIEDKRARMETDTKYVKFYNCPHDHSFIETWSRTNFEEF